MVRNLKVKLNKYWGSISKIFVAHHVVEHSVKNNFIQIAMDKLHPEEEYDGILKGVKETIYRLFDFYVALTTPI